jgi:uncharacterized surface protein with fasciclin (FAS1) repeats
MKFTSLLPLAVLSTAYVVVDEAVLSQIALESNDAPKSFLNKLPSKDDIFSPVKETYHDVVDYSENAIDRAIHAASHATDEATSAFQCYSSMTAFDPQSWLDSAVNVVDEVDVPDSDDPHRRPHHRPHHRPGHGRHGHHGKPNHTIWELINMSKYTTKLAKLIGEYDDLVNLLNGTTNNFTLFAPTDKAFERIPGDHKPDKQTVKNILAYHVSPDFYPARRVLVTHTIPSSYHEVKLGGELQRLRVGLGLFKGLNINFFSRIVAVDIVSLPYTFSFRKSY